ncbi:glutathione-dependent formaldehyde-activating enzyme domain-containing protein [Sarocladium implicatum]|nr:glutathione-dependent formaldehyde-activating enzyme domain-containing protein [Sarocladium implicatum]
MAITNEQPSVTLTASCLCNNHVFTTILERASLPLESAVCHCTSCRHVTGALFTHDAQWPGPLEPVTSAGLSSYPMTKNVRLLFCGKCSSPMFWWEHFEGKPEVLDVLIGALECDVTGEVVKTMRHGFVGDTKDGGAAPWLNRLASGQEDIPMWRGSPDKSERIQQEWLDKSGSTDQSLTSSRDQANIPIVCHCRGVNLVLRRSAADFANTDSDKLPWFIEPDTYRNLACFDGCNSCRKSFGVNVANWTFTFLKHIAFASDAGKESAFPVSSMDLETAISDPNRDERYGTLQMYNSSEGVQRYFCSRCSASVFYAADDRPDIVDLAIGLLDSQDGARVESKLGWMFGSPASWEEDTKRTWRQPFVSMVTENAEAWRVRTERKMNWQRANRERAAAGGQVET